MMSATHLVPCYPSMSTKEKSNTGPDSVASEGVATKVGCSGTLDVQVAGIATEKNMWEQVDEHQDDMSHQYPGPMLTFSDSPPKPTFDVLDSLAPPTPEAHSSVMWVSELPANERSAPVLNPDELREIFPTDLPPRPAPKSSFFSRMFKRNDKQSEDIEMVGPKSPKPQSPRYTLLPVKCHWSFLVGGWVFLMSCGAIVYWGVSEQLNKDGSNNVEVTGAVQAVAAMLKH